ncbi:MAG TPA: dipeptidyl aminopeptidase [Actinomycetota bacterium]|nr:dipeptidyl aminopeptidase [Actinomycetota bacterium]
MNHASHPIRPFSSDPDFDYEIRCALGNCTEGAGDPGEILAAVASVHKGDHEGWYSAWWELAERTLGTALSAAAGEHSVSAAQAYLRASAYYANAVNALSAFAGTDRISPTFAKQEEAWKGFVEHTTIEVETVGIPYEGRDLPGWFFRPVIPTGATLVVVNGSDGSRASLWTVCAAALRRGYNVLLFDGPGQQSELFERGVPFRFDWEHVLTPVYDFVSTLDGVDSSRIAVYGISQGSYWVARAIAFDHRFVAAITDPGLVDVSTSWTRHLPASLRRLLDSGADEKFDREMALGMKFSPGTAHTWQFRARPYGTTGYAQTIQAVRQYTVADVAAQITTPLLILSPEEEQFWPGQSEQLAELTGRVSTLVRFTAAEGAAGHCQPLAPGLTAQRMFDWLDDKTKG